MILDENSGTMKNIWTIFYLFLALTTTTNLSFSQTNYYVEKPANGGNNSNSGLSGFPKATLSNLLSSVSLSGGDTVFVGAGTYTDAINIGTDDGGSVGSPVVIQGVDSAQTIFSPSGSVAHTWQMNSVSNITIANIKVDEGGSYDDLTIIDDCENLTMTNCWFYGDGDNIQIQGSVANNITILNSYIDSYSWYGIEVLMSYPATSDDVEIAYCDIKALNSTGIRIRYGDNSKIHHNKIYSTGGMCIYLQEGDQTEIYNNYIIGKGSSTVGFQNKTTGNNGELYFNSFYVVSDHCVEFYNSGNNANWTVKNNSFYNNSTSSSDYCLYVAGSSKFDDIDNNTYYHPNSARCAYYGGARAALVNFQAVNHSSVANNGDVSSNEVDPQYEDAPNADLDLLSTSSLIGAGVAVSGISDDINTTTRNAAPTIGAFELFGSSLALFQLNFEAELNEGVVQLDWSLNTDQDHLQFEIERSSNGEDLETVYSSENGVHPFQNESFDAIDNNPLEGVSYYRVKVIETATEEVHYSQWRSVEWIGESLLNLYPNPSNGQFTIRTDLIGELSIYDQSGKRIYFENLQEYSRTSAISLSSGVYIVQINSSKVAKRVTEKLVVY